MQNHQKIQMLIEQLNKVVIGQEHVVKAMIIALLTDGHVLLEGLPGTAKTRAVKSLANALGLAFSRIQFTPDMLPSDITGSQNFDKHSGDLVFQTGPIFNCMVLADEINRAPAKVQAALLEAMAEGTVSAGGESMLLPEPFMVLATQNPVEQEGTYPLPEAQLDRFLMKVNVDYPDIEAEKAIIRLVREEAIGTALDEQASGSPLSLDASMISEAKTLVRQIHVSEAVEQYIADLVTATRYGSSCSAWIAVGASPRASIALDKCARANAWLEGRDYVTPDDVRLVALPVLGHRIMLSYDAISEEISQHDVVTRLLCDIHLT
ncbi:AAA family ATPase [Vibrio superstes]|uniref:ATPase AAA n=1 Tax=Vibrio superstes NBRC 103154 TaxID=1219062 RepID=A0A511QPI1_9VIBR|nr:MoxR family ATPase [Vibrio superstes]GEM79027.1 ATPase AAA [Vibrio superstes NBRC 103154]